MAASTPKTPPTRRSPGALGTVGQLTSGKWQAWIRSSPVASGWKPMYFMVSCHRNSHLEGGGNTMRTRKFWIPLAAVGAISLAVLAGCVVFGSTCARPTATATRTPTPTATPTPSAAARDTATTTASPTPVFVPTLDSVPQGTVVAEGSVTSPKGSIHFRYRMVANGDNTYSAEYSDFSSTVPVPVSVTLLEIQPEVGDGLTYHGVGDHVLGGPTAGATSSTALIGLGQPSPLVALVTYSSVGSDADVPLELGPDKVLAVTTVRWTLPVRSSNVLPNDGGPRPGATGTVRTATASGAPRNYIVAEGDTTDAVAARFGIAVEALVWLNADIGTIGSSRNLYASTTLNLDPDSL